MHILNFGLSKFNVLIHLKKKTVTFAKGEKVE